MKVVSFDVGIKNLAYCVFVYEEKRLCVQDWGIVNLLDQPKSVQPLCNHVMTKQGAQSICSRNAKYRKDDAFLCEIHAKSCAKRQSWTFEKKEWSKSSLKLQTKEFLQTLLQSFSLNFVLPSTKKECLEKIEEHLSKVTIYRLENKRAKGANEVDLVSVGKNMKTALNAIDALHHDVTHVLIENQISKIATRMKTVQGMLTQYFIMQDHIPEISYISSSNKLKDFQEKGAEDAANTYSQHKKDSVKISRIILEENPDLGSWEHLWSIAKKDDLADSFLQGLWFFKNRKLITYADNLKINCITLT